MTMQVGMVGTDGIVLASDTWWTQTPMVAGRGARHGYHAEKIRIFEKRGIAISAARDMETAIHVGNRIVADPRLDEFPPDRAILVQEIGDAALSEVDRHEAQCLLAFQKPVPTLYAFQYTTVNQRLGAMCQRITDGAVHTGDTVNSVTFWSEMYSRAAPINYLVPLAAHLIRTAGKLNTAMIRGLEIVLCRAEGFERLPEDVIRKLAAKSDEWDKQIGEMILSDAWL